MRWMPAWLRRCIAPIHNSKSGLTGFFTRTGTSTPCKQSASDCTAKGFAVVRAPIHSRSMSCCKQSSTCSGVATSVPTSIPVSFFTRCNHFRALSPTPSKPPGLVRGFHTPARKIWQPFSARACAVWTTWSSVSAEQGPAITKGCCASVGRSRGRISSSICADLEEK